MLRQHGDGSERQEEKKLQWNIPGHRTRGGTVVDSRKKEEQGGGLRAGEEARRRNTVRLSVRAEVVDVEVNEQEIQTAHVYHQVQDGQQLGPALVGNKDM